MYITEAINELDDGKYIRRDAWDNKDFYLYKQGKYIFYVFSSCRDSYETPFEFDVDDLRGNDWVCIDRVTTIDNEYPNISTSNCIKCDSTKIDKKWIKKDRYIKINGTKTNAKHESMLYTCTNCKYEWLLELGD